MADRTEYQQMFYKDMFARIKWHSVENDLTPAEIVGMLHIIQSEITEEIMMDNYHFIEDDEDEQSL